MITSLNNEVKKVQSFGILKFKHKNKKIFEAFLELIKNTVQFLKSNNLAINKLFLSGLSFKKFRNLRKFFSQININYCKIINKTSFNGCRLKKKKRKKNIKFKLKRKSISSLTIY